MIADVELATQASAAPNERSSRNRPTIREEALADRRADRRLDIRLPIEICSMGEELTALARSFTQNVSTGGLSWEMDRSDFQVGDSVHVQLTFPPMEGVSPYACQADCTARILRVHRRTAVGIERFGVAAQFLERLHFSY